MLGLLATSSNFGGGWPTVRTAAGYVAPRLFDARERLFGAPQPEVIFWRDAAGWCPFCCMTWLLLEEMRVPYQVRTVPLRRYMRPGEQKDPDYLRQVGPGGVVPGVQFRNADHEFLLAIQGVEQIVADLAQRFPERYPRGDDSVHTRVLEGSSSIFARLRVARRAYEACAGAQGADPMELGLGRVLEEIDEMLAESGGPFLCGERLSAADCVLLPLLERTEAVVPYFFGFGALEALPFDRAARMLAAARTQSVAFEAVCSDSSTLGRTNLRYADDDYELRYFAAMEANPQQPAARRLKGSPEAVAAIDGTEAGEYEAWAADATEGARREAAGRLAARPAAVAAFATRCATGSSSLQGLEAAAAAAAATTIEEALLAVASLLLTDEATRQGDGLRMQAHTAADALRGTHGSEEAINTAAALEALSLNIGVPRDMGVGPARALRSHMRLLAAALHT